MPVTDCEKRYVFACAACGRLDEGRRDQLTCSTACRVWLHRHPAILVRLRAVARHCDVPVSGLLHAHAIVALCPELEAPIMARTLTMADAQPLVLAALGRRAMQAAALGQQIAGNVSAEDAHA